MSIPIWLVLLVRTVNPSNPGVQIPLFLLERCFPLLQRLLLLGKVIEMALRIASKEGVIAWVDLSKIRIAANMLASSTDRCGRRGDISGLVVCVPIRKRSGKCSHLKN